MIGDIMKISRLRLGTDGVGVTTLVAFFGCPLNCKYCINDFCHGRRAIWYGEIPRAAYTPKELIKILEKDDVYFRMSDGGVTFGGGEPLMQSAFIHKVCKLAPHAWKKRIETSLNVPWRFVALLVDDLDEWIIDVKDIDETVYEEYTGASNRYMKDNLVKLAKFVEPSKLRVRVPRIPNFNNEENVQKSVQWIKDVVKVNPEVFDYTVTPKINQRKPLTGLMDFWDDDDESFWNHYNSIEYNDDSFESNDDDSFESNDDDSFESSDDDSFESND